MSLDKRSLILMVRERRMAGKLIGWALKFYTGRGELSQFFYINQFNSALNDEVDNDTQVLEYAQELAEVMGLTKFVVDDPSGEILAAWKY